MMVFMIFAIPMRNSKFISCVEICLVLWGVGQEGAVNGCTSVFLLSK